VDSGASFSIFNAEIADYLGLDYRKGDKIYPARVGGLYKRDFYFYPRYRNTLQGFVL